MDKMLVATEACISKGEVEIQVNEVQNNLNRLISALDALELRLAVILRTDEPVNSTQSTPSMLTMLGKVLSDENEQLYQATARLHRLTSRVEL